MNGSSQSNKNEIDEYDTKIEASKHVSKETVKIRNTFTYDITIKNKGELDATQAKIINTLPEALKVVSITVNKMNVTGNLTNGILIGKLKKGESFDIVITVLVKEQLDTPFINELEATYYFKLDSNKPLSEQKEIIMDEGEIGRNPNKPYNGITTILPNITMNKRTDKKEVAVGEIITYYVDLENAGTVVANNITFVDLLAGELEFIEDRVTIDGIKQEEASIITGIDLGTLEIGQKLTVGYEALVLGKGTINNQANVEYTYIVEGIEEAGKDTSNINQVNASETKLTVKKEANATFAVLEDEITYTITIRNETQSIATNILLIDDLSKHLELIEGSVTIDGKTVNRVNLEKGINIGDIKLRETKIITYQVKVTGSTCNGMIENRIELSYSYILPDGSVGLETLTPEGDAISIIEMGISNFKQFSIESYLQIPEVKPGIESINLASATIDVKNCHVITTSINQSMENQRITGYKLVVHGLLNLMIEYTALEETQTVHSAHYTIPFSTFVVLPKDYIVGSKIEVEGIVEDIYYNAIDFRNFFQNTTTLINVKMLMC